MEKKVYYGTVTEAIAAFQQKGYTEDFNIEENWIACQKGKFGADEFEIMDLYRYEGNTDPADEATVYAIQSNAGLKGILVTGYGASADIQSSAILAKLQFHK